MSPKSSAHPVSLLPLPSWIVSSDHVYGMSQESVPGTCPSSWVVFPLPAGGLLKSVEGKIALPGYCFTSPTPPQIGVLPPTPHPSLWGTSRGSFAASVTPSSAPSVSETGGSFISFVCLLCLFLFKDAAGQMEGDLFAHLAQGSEKGTPWARGDQLQYCTSWPVARGCVQ